MKKNQKQSDPAQTRKVIDTSDQPKQEQEKQI